jgi:hypothetical protein
VTVDFLMAEWAHTPALHVTLGQLKKLAVV